MLNHVISLLHTLWITNLGNKQKSPRTLHRKDLRENQKFLPLQLVNEFLHILIALLRHIRLVAPILFLGSSIVFCCCLTLETNVLKWELQSLITICPFIMYDGKQASLEFNLGWIWTVSF